jgi:60 kDa SS-A/Ro ribonucleoprotein
MTDALEQIRTRGATTPQREQADPRQVKNRAGGFVFEISEQNRIKRFLTLGAESTYYAGQREMTLENGGVILAWAREHPAELVALAEEISVAGRAPRNQPALLAVMAAMSLGDVKGRRAAERAFTKVARTGTHLFTGAKYSEQFGGWGPVTRRAFAGWYLGMDPEALAYQMAKYRRRQDWTHADVLRMAHAKPRTDDGTLMAAHNALFGWATGRDYDATLLPKWITAYERAREIEHGNAKASAKASAYVGLIGEYPGIAWEMLPDEATSSAEVWRALIDAGLPLGALLRQLPKLTRLGVLAPMSTHLSAVCARLQDQKALVKARIHPIAVLIALKTYARGRSLKGDSTWTPVPQVIDALNAAFYLAYGAVTPAGKRILTACDTSASMTWDIYKPQEDYRKPRELMYPFTAVEVAGGLALVTANTEPAWGLYGFAHAGLYPLQISPAQRLDDVMAAMLRHGHGGTDCAAPMEWARKNRVEVDVFRVITDNETWFGSVHPHQALENYRQALGIDARLQVISITATGTSIADPADPRQIDVAGFDSDVPQLLANHARGDI